MLSLFISACLIIEELRFTPFAILVIFLTYLRIVELKEFLTQLSDLPGSYFAISTHLFPTCCQILNIFIYSCSEIGSFEIFGFRKFAHLSLHCFAVLFGFFNSLLNSAQMSTHDRAIPSLFSVFSSL